MKKEDKEILLKDICARLPYLENWVQFEGKDYIITGYGHGRVSLLPSPFSSAVGPCPLIEEVKPYLRPMSSMTEEETSEYFNSYDWEPFEEGAPFDWLNKNHFDYRRLIEKGLAIEAPKGMYKEDNQ